MGGQRFLRGGGVASVHRLKAGFVDRSSLGGFGIAKSSMITS